MGKDKIQQNLITEMQKSAFKFHSGNPEEYNTLEYFFNLKNAKSELKKYSFNEEMLKDLDLVQHTDSNSVYGIFNASRNRIFNKNKQKSSRIVYGNKGLKV